ncbi:type I polyketide synthase [Streptomyces sp. S186]|uniref:type I polyketide synthase n=1 Tax=Streptomyces sp. S186 TaxID=3434395 RepID=UPI003F67C086
MTRPDHAEFDGAETDGAEFDGAIAVVGMAGRFPGAADVASFWRNVRGGVESVSFFSEEELAAEGVAPELFRRPDYVPAKAVLDDWDHFDAGFFDVSAREAELTDPQQRLFLETSWSALEDAGYAPGRVDGRVGVYAGSSISTYLLHAVGSDPELFRALFADELPLILGNGADFLATRVAYKLGLNGPAMTVQTACSTSLVALHHACQALAYAECDMAVAGGVSVQVPHRAGYVYREGGPMSQDGHCRAFDASGGGAVGGSGVGAVVLKRWADAVADGDFVYAVVRGSAVNNDGAVKVGFTAPSVAGQAAVITDALEVSGVDPASIGLVEAHGTGTALGDPIEVAALTQAWRGFTERSGFCALGSVKSNVGHLDAAAGVTGFIKAVLSVRDGVLPPSLNFEAPNPQIDFAGSPFFVNTELRPWEGEGPRRAAVSSFGMGGTNAHVVLEQAPPAPARPGARAGGRDRQVLPVSARSAAALAVAAERLAERLDEGGVELADAAFTLQAGRDEFAHRRAVVARTAQEAAAALRRTAAGSTAVAGRRPVTFLLSGAAAGDRLPDVLAAARAAYAAEPVFREHFDRVAEAGRTVLGHDLREATTGNATADPATGAGGNSDAVVFAAHYALARLWTSWGVAPQALLGTGAGAYAAACLAGILPLGDALALAAGRTPDAVAPQAPAVPYLSAVTGTWITDAEAADPAYWTGGAAGALRVDGGVRDTVHKAGDPVLLEIGFGAPGVRPQEWADAGGPAVPCVHSWPADEPVGDGDETGDTTGGGPAGALARLWSLGVEVDWSAYAADRDRRRIPLPTYPFERRGYRLAPVRKPAGDGAPAGAGPAPQEPPAGAAEPAALYDRPELPSAYVAPRDELESMVTDVWQRLLGYRLIGVDDNFYGLGGDSLLATRVVAALREALEMELPMERILEAVTPGQQAEAVRMLMIERLESMSDEEAARLLGDGGSA